MQASFCDHCGQLSATTVEAGRKGIQPHTIDLCHTCLRRFDKFIEELREVKSHAELMDKIHDNFSKPSKSPTAFISMPMDISIKDWCIHHGLSARAYNCLRSSATIRTKQDLAGMTKRDLLRIRHLGRVSLNEILDALGEEGIELP
jgi:DNA-directed RNA polymerase alpha subunit